MLIGLPNPDGSFTMTMFMPFDLFDTIKTEDDLKNFFNEKFPDALELIGWWLIKANKKLFYKF